MPEPASQRPNSGGSKKGRVGFSFQMTPTQRTGWGAGTTCAISSLFLLCGLGVVGYSLPIVMEAGQSVSWPTVDGRITHSEVLVDANSDAPLFDIDIRYTYRVEGVSYHGTRFSYDWWQSTKQRYIARRHTSRYPVGKIVQVYYDPNDPGTCTLEPGFGNKSLSWIAGGLAFATFGASIFLLGFPFNSRTPPKVGCFGILLFVFLVAFAIWTGV